MAITLNLTQRQAAGLAELISLAQRGREDFEAQAETGDYSSADQDAAAARWRLAQEAIAGVNAQQCQGPQIALEALEEWADVARGMFDCEAWGSFTCIEAEATAELARVIGRDKIAEMIIECHARGDDDPEDDHYIGSDDGER